MDVPCRDLLSGCEKKARHVVCIVCAGLDLEQEGQRDAESSDIGDLQSPTKAPGPAKPCNYLSAMLSYIAQVGL